MSATSWLEIRGHEARPTEGKQGCSSGAGVSARRRGVSTAALNRAGLALRCTRRRLPCALAM